MHISITSIGPDCSTERDSTVGVVSSSGKKRRSQSPPLQIGGSIDDEGNAHSTALLEAGRVVKQKQARQKRKPKRLAEDETFQSLVPRSGQVRDES